MAKSKKVNLVITFTDGWEERISKAFYELYEKLEKEGRNE